VNISLAFLRVFFVLLSIFFMATYMATSAEGTLWTNIALGSGLGFSFGLLLIGFDTLFRRFNLRAFNIAILGMFLGYLMGQALVLILDSVLAINTASSLQPQTIQIIKISLFLFGIYLGTILTLKAADEIHVSIPFVKFAPLAQKKKDLLIDLSVLSDARVIDLASTGLLDHQLVIPRFLVKEVYTQSEIGDEMAKSRARRCLDIIKKLEAISTLELRYNDSDFPEIKEINGKLVRLARLLDANMLTSDTSRIQMASVEGIRIINLNTLSNALKPLMQTGEFIKIKIQRYGKEPRQGVGYLDDGTMVVVNGGGQFLGDTIDAQVLSVKHTSSGRMIFCNALDEENLSHEFDEETVDEER
jgi:uncharacterized protein YacL